MISLKRSTVIFLMLMAAVVGAGLGTWGAAALDLPKPARAARARVQGPIVPAALPIPSTR